MHVVWKRPDGYLGASPSDYNVIELEGHSRLWLHRSDRDGYPFRVSGGWEEEDASIKLNNLVNLLGAGDDEWMKHLSDVYGHSLKDSPEEFFSGLEDWLVNLLSHLKGDSWEVDILNRAISLTKDRLLSLKIPFIEKLKQKT